jgi:acylphosphatase
MKVRRYILVSGKVQGVLFRSGTKKIADELHIFGWVRNLDDGSVEAVLEGEQDNVEKMIEWCRKGPSYANVKDVQVMLEEYKGKFKDFSVRR